MEKVNMKTEGWAPLAHGKNNLFSEDIISKLGTKYKKTPAQIVLRWHIQSGFITIPKSSNAERIKENFDIFDFELTEEEMSEINKLDGKKGRIQVSSWLMRIGLWFMPKPKE